MSWVSPWTMALDQLVAVAEKYPDSPSASFWIRTGSGIEISVKATRAYPEPERPSEPPGGEEMADYRDNIACDRHDPCAYDNTCQSHKEYARVVAERDECRAKYNTLRLTHDEALGKIQRERMAYKDAHGPWADLARQEQLNDEFARRDAERAALQAALAEREGELQELRELNENLNEGYRKILNDRADLEEYRCFARRLEALQKKWSDPDPITVMEKLIAKLVAALRGVAISEDCWCPKGTDWCPSCDAARDADGLAKLAGF
jgi:hypothetical protein